jgi:hypothetical protein
MPDQAASETQPEVQISFSKCFDRLQWSGMAKHLAPLKRLKLLVDLSGCKKLLLRQFNYNPDYAPVSLVIPEACYSLSEARKLSERSFDQPVVGVYWHDHLIGIGKDVSIKQAKATACRAALDLIEQLEKENGWDLYTKCVLCGQK